MVFSQFESAEKPKKIDYSIFEAEVGKQYWIKANPKAISRIEFGSELGNYQIEDRFVVTNDLKFTVTGWKLNEIEVPFLKVQFENGKNAYLPVYALWKYKRKVFDNLFDGTEYYDFREYLFRTNPDTALAEFRKNATDKKLQAEAEYKAKGGVRIGMSKEEVLKSNWGKPQSINKTILANGTREQWVYGLKSYLYFTNDILTTIQN